MNINYQVFENLKPLSNKTKQKILILNGLIDRASENKIHKSVKKSLSTPTKIFKHNNKIVKYEYNDSNKFSYDLKKLYNELNSKKFISLLKKIFNLKELYSDGNNLYSGLNLSFKNSILKEHIDFN